MSCFGHLPYAILLAFALVSAAASPSLAQQLETLNVSYASVTGSRIPLWIAKDAGLFEKNGLNVNLVVIAAGTAAIGALASGDVEILGAPGSTTMVSAAKGLPIAIIGTFGPSGLEAGGSSLDHIGSRTARQDCWHQPAGNHHRVCHATGADEARLYARQGHSNPRHGTG